MQVNVSDVICRGRYRKDYGNIPQLAESIEELGLLQPIVIDTENRLIAGARRLKAFKHLKREKIPAVKVKNLAEALDRLKAERDENVCRKEFTPSEAVAISQRIEEVERKAAKGRRGANQYTEDSGKLPESSKGDSRDKIGEAIGMSGKTWEKAKAVVESGNTELIEKMDATGKVDPQYKELQKQEQLKEDKKKAREAIKVIESSADDGIYHGDSFELAKQLPDKSCALIFTDPPYDKDSLHLYRKLGMLASKILVDGGSLITYLGQYAMQEVINNLTHCPIKEWYELHRDCGDPPSLDPEWVDDEGEPIANQLKFFWPLCCLHTGQTAQMRLFGIKVKWKPMLWFVKGTNRRDTHTWVDDLVVSEQEKCSHPWQQSVIEASYYIETLTNKGELVIDPFCGGGTTALAAKGLERKWWTADVNPSHVKTAKERIK